MILLALCVAQNSSGVSTQEEGISMIERILQDDNESDAEEEWNTDEFSRESSFSEEIELWGESIQFLLVAKHWHLDTFNADF